MAELTAARLDEFMVILYAVSLVFYFIDYLKRDRRAHGMAFALLLLVYLLQTMNISIAIIQTKRMPIFSLFDSVYLYAWLLMTISLILHASHKYSFMIFFLNVLGFIFLTIHTFGPTRIAESPIRESLISEWLVIHISFAILSYVAFGIGFVFAVLYLLVYQLLKEKKWTKQFGRYPSLHQTTLGMKFSTYVGIPILFISLVLGINWANAVLDDWSLFDFKIVTSFVVLLIYGSMLFFQQRGKLQANDYAWAHIIAFLVVIINYFLAGRFSDFHYWL